MPVTNINGVNLNYEVAGQGKTVGFLHGYTGSSQDWTNQVPLLSPKYRVITPDQRGHGKSAVPLREEDYSMQIFRDDVFTLLKKLNVSQCCLAGHSLGGFIALEFALAYPDMVAALVLVDTSSGEFERALGYAELRQNLDELARSRGMEAAFEYEAANNPVRVERFQKHPELKEITRQKMLMTSVDGYVFVSKAMGKWQSVTARLADIKVPTLIYWGDEDTPFTKAVQTLKDGIAGSELVTVKGAGHNPHEEAPDVFNEALLKFLNRIKW